MRIELDLDSALVLFEYWSMSAQDNDYTPWSPADAILINEISSEMEYGLPEAFKDKYGQLLKKARSRIESRYRKLIAESDWLDRIEYRNGNEQSAT